MFETLDRLTRSSCSMVDETHTNDLVAADLQSSDAASVPFEMRHLPTNAKADDVDSGDSMSEQ